MPASLTEVLDNLYASTFHHRREAVIDNVFAATPFWFYLKEKKKLKSVSGGRQILDTIEYAENDSVSFIGRGGTVSLNDREFLTNSVWNWHYLVGSIVRFGVDDQQNRGKTRILDLANAKVNNLQESLISLMETTLCAGAGAVGGAFDGLQHLVKNDPTTGAVVGNIDPTVAAGAYWRNKTDTMSGSSFATNGTAKMRTMVNNCMNNRAMDRPDIILTTQTVFEFCEDNILDKFQIQDKKMADLGFENIKFKNIPLIWSPSVATGLMYFLNTRFITFHYDPAVFFDMTEWKSIPDQVNDRAAQVITACGFTTNRRRVQGVIHTIDTA